MMTFPDEPKAVRRLDDISIEEETGVAMARRTEVGRVQGTPHGTYASRHRRKPQNPFLSSKDYLKMFH